MESKALEEKNSTFEKPENIVIKNASQILLLASSLLVAISVLYNLAYFQIIAPEYFNLLTVNDHINAALGWLAYTPLAVLPTIIWQYAFKIQEALGDISHKLAVKFIRRKRTFRFLLKTGLTKKSVGRLVFISEVFCLAVTVMAASIYLTPGIYRYAKQFFDLGFSSEAYDHLKILTLILMFMVIIAYNTNKLSHWFVRFAIMCALIAIPVITGKTEAKQALQAKYDEESKIKELYNLQTSSGIREHVVIMRSIEKGLIFRDTHNNTVSFITWDKIQDLSSYPSSKEINASKK